MNNSKKIKLASKTYLILVFINLFFSTNVYLLFVITPEFAMNTFQASSAQAGLAASAYMAGALLSRLVAARLLSRFGYKRTLVYGAVANATYYLCIDLGNCIGPILAGLLIPSTGYRGMFMAIAAVAFFTLFEFWFVYGRKTR